MPRHPQWSYRIRLSIALLTAIGLAACAHTEKNSTPTAVSAKSSVHRQMAEGKKAVEKMAGCYLVDYNYTETESLKVGYSRDPRLYDVNKVKAVKEWIYSEELSPTRIRLQHICL